MKIFLIGMPLVGKTTIGKELAKIINYEYIDLDDEIEMNERETVYDIITKKGERIFRKIETKTLLSALNKCEENTVISCGGGIILKRVNQLILSSGTVVLLKTDLSTLKERMKHDYTRPLLIKEKLDKMFKDREKKYLEFANLIVYNNKTVEEVVDDLIKGLGLKNEDINY